MKSIAGGLDGPPNTRALRLASSGSEFGQGSTDQLNRGKTPRRDSEAGPIPAVRSKADQNISPARGISRRSPIDQCRQFERTLQVRRRRPPALG